MTPAQRLMKRQADRERAQHLADLHQLWRQEKARKRMAPGRPHKYARRQQAKRQAFDSGTAAVILMLIGLVIGLAL